MGNNYSAAVRERPLNSSSEYAVGVPARRNLAGAMNTSAAVASWESARWRCILLFRLFGLFEPLSLAESHAGAAAVFVDEFDACEFHDAPMSIQLLAR